jgi:CheY-like chemotaxis protein
MSVFGGRGVGARVDREVRVLVVDDNLEIARAMKLVLTTLGCRVEIAHDAPNALAIADSFEPELALVDLGLPGMDGCELGRRLRSRRQITLVAVTGYDDQARTREAGFDLHLLKPIDLAAIERAIIELTVTNPPGRKPQE